MTSRVTHRLARRCTGALLALWAVAVAAPESARAGCTHEAFVPPGSIRGVDHFDRLAGTGALPNAGEPGRGLPASPCAGLSCGKGPIAPPAPGVSAVPRVEAWADLMTDPPADPSASSRPPVPASDGRAISRGSSVFHPPRAAL